MEDAYIIFTDKMVISYHPKNNILAISYHVTTKPHEVHNTYVSVFKNMKEMDITVGDVFVMVDHKMMTGKEAIKLLEEQQKARHIQEFIEDQKNQYSLCFMESFDC